MDLPPDYPTELTETAYLADGTEIMFRAILPEDTERLTRLFYRLSPRSIYLRFFTPVPAPQPHMIERLANVDYVERLAIVALIDDEIVGVARFDRTGFQLVKPTSTAATEAEAAVIVEDAWQGRGIATRLLWRLTAAARARGVTAFTAEVLGENRPMMGLLQVIADELELSFVGGEYAVRLWLDKVRGLDE